MMILTCSILFNLHARSIDFTLVFEQYLEVKFERKNGSGKLSQPDLIQRFIDAIGGMQTSKLKLSQQSINKSYIKI